MTTSNQRSECAEPPCSDCTNFFGDTESARAKELPCLLPRSEHDGRKLSHEWQGYPCANHRPAPSGAADDSPQDVPAEAHGDIECHLLDFVVRWRLLDTLPLGEQPDLQQEFLTDLELAADKHAEAVRRLAESERE